MELTATRIVFTVPLISTLTRCRFGLNLRLVMPVTLRPTPPRYFALPRRRILLPRTGFLPVIAQCIPIAISPPHAYAGTSHYSDMGTPDKFKPQTALVSAIAIVTG